MISRATATQEFSKKAKGKNKGHSEIDTSTAAGGEEIDWGHYAEQLDKALGHLEKEFRCGETNQHLCASMTAPTMMPSF